MFFYSLFYSHPGVNPFKFELAETEFQFPIDWLIGFKIGPIPLDRKTKFSAWKVGGRLSFAVYQNEHTTFPCLILCNREIGKEESDQ